MTGSSYLHAAWQVPVQWPPADAARARGAHRGEAALKAALLFAMIALTLLDRFGLHVLADFSVPPGLVAIYGLAAVLVLTGAARLDPRGALAYLAILAVTALSLVVNTALAPPAFVSKTSFLLLLVLYAPFVLAIRPGAADAARLAPWTLRTFVTVATFVAAAGIAQFFAQFVVHADWLFDYGPLIPDALRASGGWKTVYSIGPWIKSNGFFFREPSIFSIVIAIALLCELSRDKRKWVIGVLGAALVLTYSGSGLVCLAIGMMFPLGRGTLMRILAFVLLGGAILLVFGDALNLSYTVARVDEFASDRSSAYCRFVYPGAVVLQQIDSSPWTVLLGHGPGTMERMGATCSDGAQTTYAKALFEYGLAGMLAFGALIFGALSRSAAPVTMRAGLAATWLLLGGNLLASEVLLFIYILSAIWPDEAPAP